MRRLSIFSILFFLMIAFFKPSVSFSADAAPAPSTEESNQVVCDLTENNKKSIAQKANAALKAMKTTADKYSNGYQTVYVDDNAPCHYMYGSISKWWKEAFTSTPAFSPNDKKGLAVAKKLLNSNEIEENFNYVNKLESSDVNIESLKKDAINASAQVAEIIEKLRPLMGAGKPETTIPVTGKTRELLQPIFNGYTCYNLFVKGGMVTCDRTFVKGDEGIGSVSTVISKLQNSKELKSCTPKIIEVNNYREQLKQNRLTAHQWLAALSDEAQKTCYCDAKTGALQECTVIDPKFEEDEVNEVECKLLTDIQAELTLCPTCGIFEAILKADQTLSAGAFNELSDSLSKLVLLGMSIFIGYQVLLLIASPAAQNMNKFLNTLVLQGFKVAIAVYILAEPSFLYENAITPILEGGFDFGLELTGDAKSIIDKYSGDYANFDNSNKLLTAKFMQTMMGAVKGFNEQAAEIPAIGSSLYCNSWQNKIWGIFPHVGMMIEGAIVYVFGLMIMLAVGFYLLDCAIHLGIICCLMPFFIACWPFKITSTYTKTGWGMFLNIFFRFVLMGVVIATAVTLISQALTAGVSKEQLESWLNANDTDALEKAMEITGLQMLLLVICCMIAMKLIRNATMLAGKFEGGGVNTGDLGSNLGGLAASAATSVGKAAVGGAGKAAMSGAGAIAEASGVKGAAQTAGNKLKGGAQKALGSMGIGSKAKMAGGRSNSGNKDSGGSSGDSGNGPSSGKSNSGGKE